VWAWLLGVWAVLVVVHALLLATLYGLLLAGVYALLCWRLPTYHCPRCAGQNVSHGPVTGALRAMFGGNHFGCRSKRCHGGQRTRWGVVLFQPARAEWLAAHPGQSERIRLGV